jgi:D-alanyl-lipoteichoic acid acyltransferase DltB (MBOAT superfamily)
MLFNSYIFLFLFLPITLGVFLWLGQIQRATVALNWLVLTSLIFYGWCKLEYLILILGSMGFNYAVGNLLQIAPRHRTMLLALGVGANLALLGYYKYVGFFVSNINCLLGTDWTVPAILLPLGISFFTFQQISYLVDSSRDNALYCGFQKYCLFVTFFPQLIAGPIVHHKEIMPQFERPDVFKLKWDNLAVGFSMFSLGLFKKVALADQFARYVSPVFGAAERGTALSLIEGWGGGSSLLFPALFRFLRILGYGGGSGFAI